MLLRRLVKWCAGVVILTGKVNPLQGPSLKFRAGDSTQLDCGPMGQSNVGEIISTDKATHPLGYTNKWPEDDGTQLHYKMMDQLSVGVKIQRASASPPTETLCTSTLAVSIRLHSEQTVLLHAGGTTPTANVTAPLVHSKKWHQEVSTWLLFKKTDQSSVGEPITLDKPRLRTELTHKLTLDGNFQSRCETMEKSSAGVEI